MSIEKKDPALKALITERNDIIQKMVHAGLMTTKEMFGLRREWKDIEKNLTPNSIDDTTTSKIQGKIDKLQKRIQLKYDNPTAKNLDKEFLELAKKYLRLAYDYLGRMYGGHKRKSRKTNRKSLRKRKNTLTKRRYRK